MFYPTEWDIYIYHTTNENTKWVCNDKWFEPQNHTSCEKSGKVMIQMWATLCIKGQDQKR
jgi:hypothetical protein